MNKQDPSHGRAPWRIAVCAASFSLLALASGCPDPDPPAQKAPATKVTVLRVEPRDTPFFLEFVGQTQSSHQVEIRARVNGFLDKRMYVEGSRVEAGQVMFQMDQKPFRTQLQAAQGSLEEQQARLKTARANLARVKPLTQKDALSQKDLDDAIGQEQAAAAAVETARAAVETARLNLGYTTVTSPVSGVSSYARVQDGSYVNPQNSLLTYVSQVDPIWVNFSLSEDDVLKYRNQSEKGVVRLPQRNEYEVEIVLADGSLYPERGRVTFADAEYNPQTGTFLVRSDFPNPENVLRPGQFVRVQLLGALRPNAIIVPQAAVLEGGQGHFVWIVDKKSTAEIRNVQVGPWHGDQWFIDSGLSPGDLVVVDGFMKLSAGTSVQIAAYAQRPREPGRLETSQAGGAHP